MKEEVWMIIDEGSKGWSFLGGRSDEGNEVEHGHSLAPLLDHSVDDELALRVVGFSSWEGGQDDLIKLYSYKSISFTFWLASIQL